MRADIFMDNTEGGGVQISVVQHGLSAGAAHKYDAVGKARTVLVAFGFDAAFIDRQLSVLSGMRPSVLLRFPVTEIPDEVLRSLGFTAAAFQVA